MTVSASAPARVDLAGGTLDLWPLHVLHPGSVTVNVAIGLFASCRVGRGVPAFRVAAADGSFDHRSPDAAGLLKEPTSALVGSLLEALGIVEPVEVELETQVPFGSGLGGSSALTVCLLGALGSLSPRDLSRVDRVDLVRDVETRVLGKPAGVQDYYPPLGGGLHTIRFDAGRTIARRTAIEPPDWDRHMTLYDTGAAHSSGMNNWEILRARLDGNARVAGDLDRVRDAAAEMSRAAEAGDFAAMGKALGSEWDARRRLAPVVATPLIDRAIEAARAAGAWAGKACGAGGGGFVVMLSPAGATPAVREALSAIGEGRVVRTPAVNRGLEVGE